ncbi:MAG: DUF6776 family protein [Gammaproteobacteria bacterium]
MAKAPPRHVVRPHAPTRRVLMGVAITLLGLFALYVVYELGRFDAGYDRLAVSQERVEHEVVMDRLEKANRELRTRLAELDTIRVGRAREQAEVSRTIGDLQAQVARQTQELAFYRGIVAQSAVSLGVKIQQLRISAGEKPGRFHVRMTLVRSVRPEDVVVGTWVMGAEGSSGGAASSLDLAAITAPKLRELPFNFRYFQNFDQDIALPSGFQPERLTVEVRAGKKGVSPLTQTFPWTVDAS